MEATANQNVPVDVRNRRILDYIDRDEVTKVAQAASDYTRIQLREDSFAMKLITPRKATEDMLDRDLDERLQIIEELEPDGPGAMWIDFQGVPESEYMSGSRYKVPFGRIGTKKYTKDIAELMTYRQDLRKILTEMSIKDGLATYDGKFMDILKKIVFDTATGLPGANQFTGKVQWTGYTGGLDKYNLTEAMKMLPRGNANGKFRLRNNCMLLNEVTAQDLKKLDVEEIGDENVSKMWRDGLTDGSPLGLKAIFTIKDELVEDNKVWFFPEEQFIGKAYYMHDWTMFMKKEAYFIEMFSYWLGGMAIGNVAGVCLADFDYVEES